MMKEGHSTNAQFDLSAGALCLNFINTGHYRAMSSAREDKISSYADLVAWCLQAKTLNEGQAKDLLESAEARPKSKMTALEQVLASRDMLFSTFSGLVAGREPQPDELLGFNQTLAGALVHLRIEFEGAGFRWGWEFPKSELDVLLAPIIHDAARLLVSPELQRVRECAATECGWLFLDRTRNGSKRWCDMRVCGNRAKVRRFRKRQG